MAVAVAVRRIAGIEAPPTLEPWLTTLHCCPVSLYHSRVCSFLPIPMTPVSLEVVDSSIKKLFIALVGLKFQSIEQGPHCARA